MTKKLINYQLMFYYRCKGFNMEEIANKIGYDRVTVNRHFLKLKSMPEPEFKALFKNVMFLLANDK